MKIFAASLVVGGAGKQIIIGVKDKYWEEKNVIFQGRRKGGVDLKEKNTQHIGYNLSGKAKCLLENSGDKYIFYSRLYILSDS